MTEPLNFFYFLVYKLPVSVLISRGQNFRLPETPALAVAGNASAKVHRGAMTMNLFGARQKQLLSFINFINKFPMKNIYKSDAFRDNPLESVAFWRVA